MYGRDREVGRVRRRKFATIVLVYLAGLAQLQDPLGAELGAGAAGEEAHTHGDVEGLLGRLAGRRPAQLLQREGVALGGRVVDPRGLHLRG